MSLEMWSRSSVPKSWFSVVLSVPGLLNSPDSLVRANDTLGLEEVQQRLHDGVIRDIERQNRKKENIRLLGEQIILTEQLEAEREKMLLAKGSQKT
ncbi:protein PET117 homolog, mitochondrial [Leptonychotes weddellii]|uniref:Protein PET117 homolog, mitochondrial n=1 Tax=Leptonychotes weddellii TaxID=9713 RepID=A0A7F8QK87_LEPWE|nr:protein PET117 homolog, mitochondrial [Leptonychotes weddellii]